MSLFANCVVKSENFLVAARSADCAAKAVAAPHLWRLRSALLLQMGLAICASSAFLACGNVPTPAPADAISASDGDAILNPSDGTDPADLPPGQFAPKERRKPVYLIRKSRFATRVAWRGRTRSATTTRVARALVRPCPNRTAPIVCRASKPAIPKTKQNARLQQRRRMAQKRTMRLELGPTVRAGRPVRSVLRHQY